MDEEQLQTGDRAPAAPRGHSARWRQYAVASVVNLLMLSFGLASGWPAVVLPRLLSAEESPLAEGAVSLEDGTWLATLITVAGIPVAPLGAVIGERWGRRAVGALAAALHLASNLVAALSPTLAAMYASRALAGCGSALGFIMAPLYVREVSDAQTVGPLGVFMTVVINAGVVLGYAVGAHCGVAATAWVFAAPPALLLAALPWLPETPVFLLRRGSDDQAHRALTLLRGPRYDVQAEIDEVKESLKAMQANTSSFSAILHELAFTRAARRACLIILVLTLNQQFSGLFCIVSYTVQIFQEAGTRFSPYTSSIIVGFMMLLGTLVSAVLCKRMGRKSLLVISNVLMALSLFGMGLYFYLKHTGVDTAPFGWTTVVCLSVYVIAFNIGLGPIMMVVYVEIFSPKLVGTVLSLFGPVPGILSFIIGKFFYVVSESIGIYTCYWGFALVCVLGVAFVIAVVPETKNRPIDSILRELGGMTPAKPPKIHNRYDRVAAKPT